MVEYWVSVMIALSIDVVFLSSLIYAFTSRISHVILPRHPPHVVVHSTSARGIVIQINL